MIVRDERVNLPSCLDSMAGIADELVIVDTGSKDGTVDLARSRDARVVETVWDGDFSRARNLGLAAARGTWLMVLDADETLPPAGRNLLRALVAREPKEAFSFVTLNTDATGQLVRGSTLRLFPNRPGLRYRFPVHEDVSLSVAGAGIPVRESGIEILHSGYADKATLQRKAGRNGAIIAAAMSQPLAPEAEGHLRYYYAVSFYEVGDWTRAAAEFERCLQLSTNPKSRFASMARVRAAESHFLSGDLDQTARCLSEHLESEVHPAALWLGAQVATRRGDAVTARACLEKVLAVDDGVFFPPVPLATVKWKALGALGEQWASSGRKDIGVQLLKLALAVRNRTRSGGGAGLAASYAAIVAGNR